MGMFRGKDELVQLCQSLSKKWGKSRSTVPLSAFAQAKSTLWSSLQRFVPWLERCEFADDFLWELRHERTLKFESRRSKALLSARKKERGTELEEEEVKEEGKILKRRERRARTILAR